MKIAQIFSNYLALLLLIACNSNGQTAAQKEAKKTADEIQKTMNANGPKMVATSTAGYYMKAVIDGKPWEAIRMYPTESAQSVGSIFGETGEYLKPGSIAIGIPVKTIKRFLYTGKKYEFKEGRAVDFILDENTFGGYKGELTITKIDDNWVEGTFFFSATSTSAPGKHEITNGVFRVAITKEN